MNIDFIIVAVYLISLVAIGTASSKKPTSVRDFSLSTHTYGSFPLIATLSASFIGGGFSTGNASKVAVYGIGNIVALWGFSIAVILIGIYVVPKANAFKTSSSVGEIMGKVYGEPARVCTGLFATLVCAGILSAQISAIGYILNVFLGINTTVGMLIGCVGIIIYSTVGGMNAIVKTDTMQFCIIAVCMPLLLYMSIKATGGISFIFSQTPTQNLNILNGYTPLGFFSFMLTLALGETLVPPYIQRLLMGNDISTTKRATIISGIISAPFFAVTGLIGLVGAVYFKSTAVNPNSIMQSLINAVVPVGLKGVMIAGMLSIVISSADSFLNSSAVSLTSDVISPLLKKSSLSLVKGANVVIGAVSVIIAVSIPNVLDILIFAYSLWLPMIFVPLIAVLLGYKPRASAFYGAMIFGGTATLIWNVLLNNPLGINSSIPGAIVSFMGFVVFL